MILCSMKEFFTTSKFMKIYSDIYFWEFYGVCVCVLSHIQLFGTPWAALHQAPPSMDLSRQEYWSRWPFPPPGDLPDPGSKPISPMFPSLAGGFFIIESPGKPGSL